MTHQRFVSVWDAIEESPDWAENLKMRSMLMIALRRRIEQMDMTQGQAAELLGVTQPRVSDLLRGKINLFSLDVLVNMAALAGLRIELQVTDPA